MEDTRVLSDSINHCHVLRGTIQSHLRATSLKWLVLVISVPIAPSTAGLRGSTQQMNHQMLAGSLNCRGQTPILLSWNSVFMLHPFTNAYLYKCPKNSLGTQARRFLFPSTKRQGWKNSDLPRVIQQAEAESRTFTHFQKTRFGISQNCMEAPPRSSQLLLLHPIRKLPTLASCPLGEDRETRAIFLTIPGTSCCD